MSHPTNYPPKSPGLTLVLKISSADLAKPCFSEGSVMKTQEVEMKNKILF